MAKLEELAAAGEDVALVLVGQSLGGTTGSELLGRRARAFIRMHSADC